MSSQILGTPKIAISSCERLEFDITNMWRASRNLSASKLDDWTCVFGTNGVALDGGHPARSLYDCKMHANIVCILLYTKLQLVHIE